MKTIRMKIDVLNSLAFLHKLTLTVAAANDIFEISLTEVSLENRSHANSLSLPPTR